MGQDDEVILKNNELRVSRLPAPISSFSRKSQVAVKMISVGIEVSVGMKWVLVRFTNAAE